MVKNFFADSEHATSFQPYLNKQTYLMAFKNLQLIEPILKALAEEGYTTPTPIQQQSIPLVLEKKDLLGTAQTGTERRGKTTSGASTKYGLILTDGTAWAAPLMSSYS